MILPNRHPALVAFFAVALSCLPLRAQRVVIDSGRVTEQTALLSTEMEKLRQLESALSAARNILGQQQQLNASTGVPTSNRLEFLPLSAPDSRATIPPRAATEISSPPPATTAHGEATRLALRVQAEQLAGHGEPLTLTQTVALRQRLAALTNDARIAASVQADYSALAKASLQLRSLLARENLATQTRDRQVLRVNFSP